MTKTQQIARVRHVLKTLRHSIEGEYLRCAIRSEADVQAVVVQHLKEGLRQHDDHWIIGANFSLEEYRPDVLCYYTPLRYDDFVRDYLLGDAALVAAIEIKWASLLKDDLRKLSLIQKQHRKGILAWMVYGDHFAPSIHKAYAAEGRQREAAIRRWARERPTVRGQTIVCCGNILARGGRARYAERLRGMRDHWWINDREAKAALKN